MYIDVNGAQVYAYTGSRDFDRALPTLVFIHGAAHDHSVWSLQSRYFAHHGRNVLAVDLPGHGKSGGEPLSTVSVMADWIIGLLDAQRVSNAVLVGHSMGSLIVLDTAARHPERVVRLVLIGPSVPMPVSDVLLEAAKRDDHVAFELITTWSFSPEHQLGGNQQPGVWMTGSALRLLERSRPGALYADLLACHGYAGGLAAAERMHHPALLIVGGCDLMAPPKNAQALIEALPHKRVVTIPNCGHSLMVEAPDAVLDALRSFV